MAAMRQQRETAGMRRRRRLVLLLGSLAGVLWAVALALPMSVLLLIDNLPGEDPARTQRSFLIAFGVFLSFALTAIPTTIGFVVVRRTSCEEGRLRHLSLLTTRRQDTAVRERVRPSTDRLAAPSEVPGGSERRSSIRTSAATANKQSDSAPGAPRMTTSSRRRAIGSR